jgi:hypothetical protein
MLTEWVTPPPVAVTMIVK